MIRSTRNLPTANNRERMVNGGPTGRKRQRLRRDEPAPPMSAGFIVMADLEGNDSVSTDPKIATDVHVNTTSPPADMGTERKMAGTQFHVSETPAPADTKTEV